MDKKVTSLIVLSLIFINTLNISYASGTTNQQYIQIHHANQKYLQEQMRIQEEREKTQREYERQQQLEELKRNPILMEEDGRHKKYFDGQNIIFTYDEMTDEEYEEFQRQNRW